MGVKLPDMKKGLLFAALLAALAGVAAVSWEAQSWRGTVELVDADTLHRRLRQDPLRLEHAFIRGHDLHLRIRYEGGAQPHEFRLLARREPKVIIWRDKHPVPPPRPHVLYLSHHANGERSHTPLEAELVFDLRPLRQDWPGPIPLRLGSPHLKEGAGFELILK